MKNKKIKKFRLDFPETNSSSTHSLVINSDFTFNREEILKDLEPYIDNNGILRISCRDFGWDVESTNSTYEKIQYAIAHICNSHENRNVSCEKEVKKLLNNLENYLGIPCIVDFSSWPQIDHQSADLRDEIFESKDSIDCFLFNLKSWLYLSNDNGGSDVGMYETEKDVNYGRITLEYPDPVGNIDIVIEGEDRTGIGYLRQEIYNWFGGGTYLPIQRIGIKNGVSVPNINNKLDFIKDGGLVLSEIYPYVKYDGKYFLVLCGDPKITQSSIIMAEDGDALEKVKRTILNYIKKGDPLVYLVRAKFWNKELDVTY